MKEVTLNFETNEIIVTRKYLEKIQDPHSVEWQTLSNIMCMYPNMRIKKHTIKKNASKESYKGLTYKYMREYILSHEPSSKVESALSTFEEMLTLSKCHSIRYPAIKKWFLSTYTEVSDYNLHIKEENDLEIIKQLVA